MKARYYVYKNLHKPGYFSVKYKGIVIDYLNYALLYNVDFKVSEPGRLLTIKNGKKVVHAYAVCDYYNADKSILVTKTGIINYHPYKADHFKLTELIKTPQDNYLGDEGNITKLEHADLVQLEYWQMYMVNYE